MRGDRAACARCQIAEALRRAITDGQLPVGSAPPSETELAATHGVSRGTVRRAPAALLAEGLTGSRQGARYLALRTSAQPEVHRAAQLRPVGARGPAGPHPGRLSPHTTAPGPSVPRPAPALTSEQRARTCP
ncbi:winged helix-turn-helix domain-containing protein [Streptomyces sp. NPDC054765]